MNKRKMTIGAAIVLGTAAYLGLHNAARIEQATKSIRLYQISSIDGADVARGYAVGTLEILDSPLDRFRHRGAIDAAAEYLGDKK